VRALNPLWLILDGHANVIPVLKVEHIIPTPEAKELMIGMSAKEANEKTTAAEQKQRHIIRVNFCEEKRGRKRGQSPFVQKCQLNFSH
jgi:hypothetical protein